jgi:glycosyltransferase involved in cell wall biosynthesis
MGQFKPRILFISSDSPYHGSGALLFDYYKGFKEANIEADFLTLYEVDGFPDIKYVYQSKKKRSLIWRFFDYLNTKPKYRRLFFNVKKGTYFFYRYEEFPPVSNTDLLKNIDKHYDLVLVLFWQGMLSFSSINAIYNKLHCQIQFLSVDYSVVAGGCHFVGNCQGYKTGCKKCDYIGPKWLNHFTAHNVQYRKKIYDIVKPIIYGNTYMNNVYKQSYLLKNARTEISYPMVDIDHFRPLDVECLRRQYGIIREKVFVVGFGCNDLNDPRKGMKYLVEALNHLASKLSIEEKKTILIVTIGNNSGVLSNCIPFEQLNLGYIQFAKLPVFYNLIDLYLSPCVIDAGPTMVNQSLCCGTPVVAFNIGTALDCIQGHNTGICVPSMDSVAYGDAIYKIFRMKRKNMIEMFQECRDYAITHYSKNAKIERILDCYYKYK